MASAFCKWIYKLLTIYLTIGIFTQSCGHVIRQSPRKKDSSLQNCAFYFISKVDDCLNPFLTLLKRRRVRHKSKSLRISEKVSQKTFCKRYEETLQCLHQTLKNCDNQGTTSYIQDRLSASWVLQVNRLCNINMENNQPNKYKTSSEPQDRVPNSEKMEKHPTVLNIDHFTIEMDFGRRVMGDNHDITHSNTRQDSVADSKEHTKLDKTENKNDLNYKPNDAFVNKQTNINVYFNPLEVKNEKISIKDFQSGKMILTFEQSDPQKNTKWKTKIGKLVFQQETL